MTPDPEMAAARAVAALRRDTLLARAGVVSVGVGRDDEGRAAVIVGVRDEAAVARLALAQEMDGVPVIVRVTGPLRPTGPAD